jgi:hypothetical protein
MLTVLGILVVPLGGFWFIRLDTTKLLYLFAATTPFSAATIIEFKGSVFGMVPSFFVALLLIGAFTIRSVLGKSKIRTSGIQKYYYLSFSLMWLYSLVSLLFPVIFQLTGSEYSLFNPAFNDQNYGSDIPPYTITQFVYFSLFLLAAFVVMNETVETGNVKKSLRILLYVAMFSIVWGLVFYVLAYLGMQYPSWMFNNHPGYSHGFDQRYAIIRRISSVAQEPSIYGYFLSIMIAMVMTLNILQLYLMKPLVQKILLFFMVITAILTTSTTAFLGIFVATMLTLLISMLCGRLRPGMGYVTRQYALMIVLAVVAISTVISKLELDAEALVRALYELTFQKSQTESGLERSWSFFHGIEVLNDTFFLGSGFASNRTFDLGSTLLANTGILGLSLFLLAFSSVVVLPLKRVMACRCADETSKIMAGLVSGLVTALVLMFLSIPDFVNMYFWLILGLLMGMSKIATNEPVAGLG